MKDLFVNFIGASVFSIFGYITLKKNKKNTFINNFVPRKEKREWADSVKKELNK